MLKYTLFNLSSKSSVIKSVSILRKIRQSSCLCEYSTDEAWRDGNDDQFVRPRQGSSKRRQRDRATEQRNVRNMGEVQNDDGLSVKVQNRFRNFTGNFSKDNETSSQFSSHTSGFEDIDDIPSGGNENFFRKRKNNNVFTADRFQGDRLTESKQIDMGFKKDWSASSKSVRNPKWKMFEEEENQPERKSTTRVNIHNRKNDTREMRFWKSQLGHTDKSSLLPKIIASGREVLFGNHPVVSALTQKKRKIHRLYIKKSLAHNDTKLQKIMPLCNLLNIPVDPVNSDVLRDLSGSRPHQGVCLEVDPFEIPYFDVENFSGPDVDHPEVWLAPLQVKDPMNMGSLLRTAYFLGVNRVLLSDNHSCKPNPIVCKASSGAMEIVNMSMMKNITSFLELCELWKQRGGKVIGTSQPTDNKPVIEAHQYTATEPTILIAGNEKQGIPEGVKDICDSFISICPDGDIMPEIDSLNVSVAIGIILHSLKVNSKAINWTKAVPCTDLENGGEADSSVTTELLEKM